MKKFLVSTLVALALVAGSFFASVQLMPPVPQAQADTFTALKNGSPTTFTGVSSGTLTLTVASGTQANLPLTGQFRAVIWGSGYTSSTNDANREYVLATYSGSGGVFNLVRAQEGTTARTWATGSYIANTITAGKLGEYETAISAKAPLVSPALVTPTATTPAVDNNSTSVATTAWYMNQLGAATPAAPGTAIPGTSLKAARADHVHAKDTTKMDVAGGTFTGGVGVGTAPLTNTSLTLLGFLKTGGTAYVTSQFNKTNDTTLQDIPMNRTLNVYAGKTYSVDGLLFLSSDFNYGGGGSKFAFSGTATMTSMLVWTKGDNYDQNPLQINVPAGQGARFTAMNGVVGTSSGSGNVNWIFKGTITPATNGTITLQFAQYTSYSHTNSVLVGSFLSIQEL